MYATSSSTQSSHMARDYRNINFNIEQHKSLKRAQRPPPPEKDLQSRLTCVGIFWALLSFLSMAMACIGFYMPFWIKGKLKGDIPSYLGTFRRCNYPILTDRDEILIVEECGRYTRFLDIPSVWWQVATVCVGSGCCIAVLVAFTAMFACCLRDVLSTKSAKIAGVLQFIAGVVIEAGCLLYPLGWENPEVRQICGSQAQLYGLGTCQLSWAYYATIAGGGGIFLCSLLSCSAARDRSKKYSRYVKTARR